MELPAPTASAFSPGVSVSTPARQSAAACLIPLRHLCNTVLFDFIICTFYPAAPLQIFPFRFLQSRFLSFLFQGLLLHAQFCNNYVAFYYNLSHFVTILNNYNMFRLDCIGIFAKYWWEFLENTNHKFHILRINRSVLYLYICTFRAVRGISHLSYTSFPIKLHLGQ